MDTHADTTATHSRLALAGELTIYAVGELHGTLVQALQQAAQAGCTLALDLAQVTEIDTAGLQLLLAATHAAREGGPPLELQQPSACVQRLVALYALSDRLGLPLMAATPAP